MVKCEIRIEIRLKMTQNTTLITAMGKRVTYLPRGARLVHPVTWKKNINITNSTQEQMQTKELQGTR